MPDSPGANQAATEETVAAWLHHFLVTQKKGPDGKVQGKTEQQWIDAAKRQFSKQGQTAGEGPKNVKAGTGIEVIASGEQAATVAGQLLENAAQNPELFSASVPAGILGTVRLEPGIIWDGNKIMLQAYPPPGGWVTYLVDNTVYKRSTSDFVRDPAVNALITAGKNAKGMATLAQIWIGAITAVVVPLGISLGIVAAKIFVFASQHPKEANLIANHWPKLLSVLARLIVSHPKMTALLIGGGVASGLKGGLEGSEIGDLIGNAIKHKGVPWLAIVKNGALGFINILKHAYHGGKVAGSAAAKAESIRSALASQGMSISHEDALAIAQEMTGEDVGAALQELIDVLDALAPAFTAIAAGMQ